MLGSHGLLFKGAALYEELVKIPLLIRPPGGLAAPHRTEQLVSHVDLVPTIVQWCGGAAPVDTHGVDIQGLSRGEDTSSRAGLALEYHSSNWGERPNPLRGWRTEQWKYVESMDGGEELYDLIEDPLETHNLIDDGRSSANRQQLAEELAEWVQTVPDSWPRVPMPEREVER